MKKCQHSNNGLELSLLLLRTTPISQKLESSAALLNQRQYRTTLPSHIINNHTNKDQIHENLQERQDKQKHHFDEHAKDLKVLKPGTPVRILDPVTKYWEPATVNREAEESRSYT